MALRSILSLKKCGVFMESKSDDSFVVNMKKFSTNVAPLESQSVIYSGDDWPISGGGKFINFSDTASVIDELGDMI